MREGMSGFKQKMGAILDECRDIFETICSEKNGVIQEWIKKKAKAK